MDLQGQNGLDDPWRTPARSRGTFAIALAALLTAFYLVLYFEDDLDAATGVRPLTPLAEAIGLENRWYLYGFLYCVAMLGGAAYYLIDVELIT